VDGQAGRLAGKVALITGAASGMQRHCSGGWDASPPRCREPTRRRAERGLLVPAPAICFPSCYTFVSDFHPNRCLIIPSGNCCARSRCYLWLADRPTLWASPQRSNQSAASVEAMMFSERRCSHGIEGDCEALRRNFVE
jgi:hypothetical protein